MPPLACTLEAMARNHRNRFASLRLLATLTGVLGFLALTGDGGGDGGTVSGEGGAPAPGGADGQGGGAGQGDPTGAAEGQPDTKPAAGKTLTQDEVNELIAKAKASERAKATAEAAEAAKRAKMDEADRLKAEKADADKKAVEAVERANQRAVRSDAKLEAVAAGVKPDRVDHFMRLLDLSDVAVDDNGDPDPKAIKRAVKEALAAVPEFKGEASPAGSSGEFGSDNGTPTFTREQIAKMSAEEFAKNEAAIDAATKAGAIR